MLDIKVLLVATCVLAAATSQATLEDPDDLPCDAGNADLLGVNLSLLQTGVQLQPNVGHELAAFQALKRLSSQSQPDITHWNGVRDWLYEPGTTLCEEGGQYDIPVTPEVFAGAFFPLFCAAAAGIFRTTKRRGSGRQPTAAPDAPRQGGDDDKQDGQDRQKSSASATQSGLSSQAVPKAKGKRSDTIHDSSAFTAEDIAERRLNCDFALVMCVCYFVIISSGGEAYAHHNVFFGQMWVMPLLSITSAATFMRIKELPSHLGWLCLAFILGAIVNYAAAVAEGANWRDIQIDLIEQMGWVALLMVAVVFSNPLRLSLLACGDSTQRIGRLANASTILGLVSVVLAFVWLFVCYETQRSLADAHSLPMIAAEVGATLFLANFTCSIGPNDLTAWVLLVFIYSMRLFVPYSWVIFPHVIQLFIFAVVVEAQPPRGWRFLQTTLRTYWPLMFVFILFCFAPTTLGRCDWHSALFFLERFRFYAIECALVISFVCGAFKVSDPNGILSWAKYWAIYAFCCVVAWTRVLPVPYGAVVTFGSAVLFWAYSTFLKT